MAAPTVSVVIPCFNQGRYLREALASVRRQTRPPSEIIVVDDGSTDDTAAVAASDPGVRCVRQPNRGLAHARNRGIQAATGDCLVFLDADDRLMPDAIAVGLEALAAHPACAFVFGRCTRIDARGAELPTVAPPPIPGDPYEALLQNNWIWTPALVMFQRRVAGPFLRFDSAMSAAADYDLYLRIARQAPIHGHGRLVAEYRLHDASMSGDPATMLRSTVRALQAQRPFVAANPRYRRAYELGLRSFRHHYGRMLAGRIASDVRRPRRWGSVLRNLTVLLRYHSGGVVRESGRSLQRLMPGSQGRAGARA
jgi:glycosyltransferase involved in cell wall biosynthesis